MELIGNVKINQSDTICGRRISVLLVLADLADKQNINTTDYFAAYQKGFDDGQAVMCSIVEHEMHKIVPEWKPNGIFEIKEK